MRSIRRRKHRKTAINMDNTSGTGPAATVPEEIKGWNWGAFLLTWLWGIFNATPLALLVFVPFVGWIMGIVLGGMGNEWAWRNKRWENVDDFRRAQRRWAIAGAA